MINIVSILNEASILAGWQGDFPDTVDELTDDYISKRIIWCIGQTPITGQQIRDIVTAYVPPTQDEINDEIYDQLTQQNKVLKALIMALNDGTFVPGSNYTNAQIKQGIKNRM